MSAPVLLQPRRVYFIGDCHSAIFNNGLFRDRASGDYIVTTSLWSATVGCDNIVTDAGKINALLLSGLAVSDLIRESDGVWKPSASLQSPSPGDDTLVVSCGEADMHEIAARLGEGVDIVWPFPDDPRDGDVHVAQPAEGKTLVPFSLLEEILATKATRLVNFLAALRSWGFADVAFLGVLPQPTPLDIAGARSELYLKITLLFHRLLRAGCVTAQVRFCDTWPHIARAGMLPREFTLDERHANARVAPLALAGLTGGEPGSEPVEFLGALHPLYCIGERSADVRNGTVTYDAASGRGAVLHSALVPGAAMCSVDAAAPNRIRFGILGALEANHQLKIDQRGGAFAYAAHFVLDAAGVPRRDPNATEPKLLFLVGRSESEAAAQVPGRATDPVAMRVGLQPLFETWLYLAEIGFSDMSVLAQTQETADPAWAQDFHSVLAQVAAQAGVGVVARIEGEATGRTIERILEGLAGAPR